jgi:hypothetical protein
MQKTFYIDKTIYDKPIIQKNQNDEVRTRMFTPPSDIPLCVSSCYNQNQNTFNIIFNYNDNETEKLAFEENNVKFFVGTYSGKPMKYEVQIQNGFVEGNIISEKNIKNDIVKFQNTFKIREQNPIKSANFERANFVINSNFKKFSSVLNNT